MSPIDPELTDLLARYVGEVNTEFIRIGRRFDDVDRRLDDADGRFDDADRRLDAVDRNFAEFRVEVRDR